VAYPTDEFPVGGGRFGKSVGGLAWFAFVFALLALAATSLAKAPPKTEFQRAVRIPFQGEITPFTKAYLDRKLREARDMDADLVLLEIDSPGGYAITSFEIADELSAVDWAHVVAYVPNEALSGAAFVALGCHEIVMDEAATLGDAGPIFLDEDSFFKHVPEKLRSKLAKDARQLAENNGRPPALAEAMVDMDLQVYRYRHVDTDDVRYLSELEHEQLDDSNHWEKEQIVRESRKGLFLTVSGKRAVELGLANRSAADEAALLKPYGVAPDEVTELRTTWVDTLVMVLNHWFITALIVIIGLVALYIEFSAPGVGLGGLIAGLCFCLFFWSRFLGGTAGWLEVTLFVAGVGFLLVELFVLPGFGVAGLTGVLLILASLILAGQTFVWPESGDQWSRVLYSVFIVFGSLTFVIVAAAVVSQYTGKVPVVSALALKPPEPMAKEGTESGASGGCAASGGVTVGDTGEALSPLRPAGVVRIGGKRVDVVTDGEFLEPGTPIRVLEVAGNRVLVGSTGGE